MDSWIYLHDLYPLNKPSPKRMVMDLQELAHASNAIDSLHKIENLFHLRENSFQIKTDRFFRELDGRTTQSEYLEILTPISINGIEDAKKILLAWMESGNRDYHRVKMPGYMIYYDKEIEKGLYYDQKTGQEIEIDRLSIESQTWEITAGSLSKLASSVEKNISLNVSTRIIY